MYNIKKDTKICLYAPTFRNSDSISCYDLDYNRLHEALVKRFSGDWVILVRYHFRLKNTKIPKKYENTVINVTNYPDMQELLCVTDFGITDYSSWICDYVITKRPGFLYTTDIEKYIDTERGFYHTLDYLIALFALANVFSLPITSRIPTMSAPNVLPVTAALIAHIVTFGLTPFSFQSALNCSNL